MGVGGSTLLDSGFSIRKLLLKWDTAVGVKTQEQELEQWPAEIGKIKDIIIFMNSNKESCRTKVRELQSAQLLQHRFWNYIGDWVS